MTYQKTRELQGTPQHVLPEGLVVGDEGGGVSLKPADQGLGGIHNTSCHLYPGEGSVSVYTTILMLESIDELGGLLGDSASQGDGGAPSVTTLL